MSLADAAGGMQNAIQQQLMRRLQAEQVARSIAQQQFSNQMAEKQFASNEEMKGAQLASLQQDRDADQFKQQADMAATLGDRLPPGMQLDEADPAVGMMQAGGAGGMLRTRGLDAAAPPAMLAASGDSGQAQEVPGTLPMSPMPSGPGLRTLTKLPSAAQENIAADNARQKAADLATAQYRQGMLHKPTGGGRDRFNVQQVTNPDGTTGLMRVNMDTGEATPVDLGGAASGRASDTQRLSGAYLDRTKGADQLAKGFEQELGTLGPQLDVQLPNLLKSEKGQLYRQSKDEFINAALRRESGAAIQPSEYERYDKIYFVQPGDTAATIRQKQTARERVIAGFKVSAGNLSGQPAGPAPAQPPRAAARKYNPATGKVE